MLPAAMPPDSATLDLAPTPDTAGPADALALLDGAPSKSGRTPASTRKPLQSPWRYLQLWPAGAPPDAAQTVRLIGVHEPQSLVISAPRTQAGGLAFVKEGHEYEFRGFSGESIYRFTAVVLKVRFEPFPYVHVGWPQAWRVEKRRLRAARRVTCRVPCIVYPSHVARERFARGHVRDLSATGAAIEVAGGWPSAATEVHLALRLEVAGQMFLAEIDGQRVGRADEDDLRVRFDGIDERTRFALHAYVNAVLVEQLETPLYAQNRDDEPAA